MAVKLEPSTRKHQTLEHEFHVLKALGGCEGVPKVHWFGSEGIYNVIVFDRLGPSLGDLLIRSNFTFSTKTVSALAKQLVIQFHYTILNAC